MKAELILASGEREKCHQLHEGEVCRIGRTSENTIQLAGDNISRNHAIVQASDSAEFFLFDLGSRNGTYVNGCRISGPTPLRNGDVISIGGQELRFVQSVVPSAAGSQALPPGATLVDRSIGEITVLVADIRGYTNLCQRIGEARVAEIMHTFNTEAGAALAGLNVWGVKYIGDAVMAIWVNRGSPLPFLVAGLRAISALLEIAGSLQARFDLESPVCLGAALNLGMASIGNMGSNAAPDHTALGDVVNKVFRLEDSTRDLQADVVLSSEVYHALQSEIDPEGAMTANTIKLKAYTDCQQVYAVNKQTLRRLLEDLGPKFLTKAKKD